MGLLESHISSAQAMDVRLPKSKAPDVTANFSRQAGKLGERPGGHVTRTLEVKTSVDGKTVLCEIVDSAIARKDCVGTEIVQLTIRAFRHRNDHRRTGQETELRPANRVIRALSTETNVERPAGGVEEVHIARQLPKWRRPAVTRDQKQSMERDA